MDVLKKILQHRMIKTILFATHNEHKVKEVGQVLSLTNLRLKSLSEIGYHKEIIEDGLTLEENAQIKSKHIFNLFQQDVISEDTGLEVDHINGAPGVHTARYAGLHRNHDDNMDKLLDALKTTSNRGAQFRTVISLIFEGEYHLFEGICRGEIALKRMGVGGFGYDPIFIPEGYNESFGVLPESVKNEVSHRARAFSKLQAFLTNKI